MDSESARSLEWTVFILLDESGYTSGLFIESQYNTNNFSTRTSFRRYNLHVKHAGFLGFVIGHRLEDIVGKTSNPFFELLALKMLGTETRMTTGENLGSTMSREELDNRLGRTIEDHDEQQPIRVLHLNNSHIEGAAVGEQDPQRVLGDVIKVLVQLVAILHIEIAIQNRKVELLVTALLELLKLACF